MKNEIKKAYRHPLFMISGSDDDMKIIKELREKYHIVISSFFREQIKKLYKKLEKDKLQ